MSASAFDWPGATADRLPSTPDRDDLLVLATAATAPGFRLAGVRTMRQDSGSAVQALVEHLVRDGFRGVIAVAAPLWFDVPVAVRAGWEARTFPLVVALPAETDETTDDRQARTRELLARSVGYEIAFTPEQGAP